MNHSFLFIAIPLKPTALIGVIDSFDFELYFPRIRLDDNNLEVILEIVRTLESIGLSSKKNFYLRMVEYIQSGNLMGPNYLNPLAKKKEGGGGGRREDGGGGIGRGVTGRVGGGGKVEGASTVEGEAGGGGGGAAGAGVGVREGGEGKKDGTRMSIAEMMMNKLDQRTGLSVQHGFLAMQIGFWAKLMEKVEDLGSLQKMINRELEEGRRIKKEEGVKNKMQGSRWLAHSQKIFEMIKFRDIVQKLISKNVKYINIL